MTSPYDADAIAWDEGNESELAAHGINPEEVEQVFDNRPVFVRNRRNRAGDRMMIGYTNGGRAITVIVQWTDSTLTLRPITGWDSTQGERSRFL